MSAITLLNVVFFFLLIIMTRIDCRKIGPGLADEAWQTCPASGLPNCVLTLRCRRALAESIIICTRKFSRAHIEGGIGDIVGRIYRFAAILVSVTVILKVPCQK